MNSKTFHESLRKLQGLVQSGFNNPFTSDGLAAMEMLDLIFFIIIATVVLAIIVSSWASPAAPRAGYGRNSAASAERSVKRSRLMIWGPTLFVAIFAVFMPTRLAYEWVQEFPQFLAYGLMVSAAMEMLLYVFVTRILAGSILDVFIVRIEGSCSKELEKFYTRELQKSSRLPLALAIILATAGVANLLLILVL